MVEEKGDAKGEDGEGGKGGEGNEHDPTKHKGHDVICTRCNLIAVEFIDYEKALKSKRPTLYARNRCLCLYKDEFYCNDCKVKIVLNAK